MATLSQDYDIKHTCYTIRNEKYFQKVSFCVITHPIGQNGRAVCKNMVTMEMNEAQSAARSARPAGHIIEHRSRVRSSTILEYMRAWIYASWMHLVAMIVRHGRREVCTIRLRIGQNCRDMCTKKSGLNVSGHSYS